MTATHTHHIREICTSRMTPAGLTSSHPCRLIANRHQCWLCRQTQDEP